MKKEGYIQKYSYLMENCSEYFYRFCIGSDPSISDFIVMNIEHKVEHKITDVSELNLWPSPNITIDNILDYYYMSSSILKSFSTFYPSKL